MKIKIGDCIKTEFQHNCLYHSQSWIVRNIDQKNVRLKCMRCGMNVTIDKKAFFNSGVAIEKNISKTKISPAIKYKNIKKGKKSKIQKNAEMHKHAQANKEKNRYPFFKTLYKNDEVVLNIQCSNFKKSKKKHDIGAAHFIIHDYNDNKIIVKCIHCGYVKSFGFKEFNECFKYNISAIYRYGKTLYPQKGDIIKLSNSKYLFKILDFNNNILTIENNSTFETKRISYFHYCKYVTENSKAEIRNNPKKIIKEEQRKIKEFEINTFGEQLKNDTWIKLNKEICNKCQSNVVVIKEAPNDLEKDLTIECLKCKNVFNINRKDLYYLIESLDREYIYTFINDSFVSLNEENRLNKVIDKYDNFDQLIKIKNLILSLQLIDSFNNHVSKGHTIHNKEILIPYYENPKSKTISLFKYKCHYCSDCDRYFDFYNSFLQQLEKANIKMENICMKIIKNHEVIVDFHIPNNELYGFGEESLLHALGYKVGYSGKTTKARQNLLNWVIKNNVLSISEIKYILNKNINCFKNRYEYSLSVSEWKEDMEYINSFIKEK